MVHDHDNVVHTVDGLVENRISGMRSGRVDAFRTGDFDSRRYLFGFGIADQSVVAGVRIQRRDGDPRIVETPTAKMLVGDADCGQDVFGRYECAGFRKRFMGGEMHAAQDAAHQHRVDRRAVG